MAGQQDKSNNEKSKSRQEALIQASCVEWFKNNYCLKHHNPRLEIVSIPNEATWKNNNFKALGVRKGASDTFLILPNKIIFVEFKDVLGSQSVEQIDFETLVTDLKHEYHIIKSFEQFKQIIWQNLPNAQYPIQ